MKPIPCVVLDACVLANYTLCDTLLRLAEPPTIFEPKWSAGIISETVRTLETKLNWPPSLTKHLQRELRSNFAEAWITGFGPLIPYMRNDEKDRHVLAAAAHREVPTIVTFNLRHFRSEHLSPWGVRAVHPQAFVIELLHQDKVLVLEKVHQQAIDRKIAVVKLLGYLRPFVPEFVSAIS